MHKVRLKLLKEVRNRRRQDLIHIIPEQLDDRRPSFQILSLLSSRNTSPTVAPIPQVRTLQRGTTRRATPSRRCIDALNKSEGSETLHFSSNAIRRDLVASLPIPRRFVIPSGTSGSSNYLASFASYFGLPRNRPTFGR
jgi:hypothetical protein